MGLMTLESYHARFDYEPALDLCRGEILGLTGGADFYGKNSKELRAEFKKSLHVFLAVCREKGIDPRRNDSGKFNPRQGGSTAGHARQFIQCIPRHADKQWG